MRKWLAVLLCVSLMAVAMPSLASQNLMDLYLFPYNDMTDEEVAAKLNAAPLAPAGGALSDKLAGKAFDVITDQGATLSFVFDAEGSGVTATVALPAPVPAPAAEGAEPVVLPAPAPFTFKSEYAAKELNNFVLFALRQPDSSSAWAVAVDLKSGLAVAFELWFAASTGGWGGDVPAREAQRTYYTGYLAGGEVPAKTPSATNRLTGKVVLWDNDEGSFYTNYGTRSWSAYYPIGQEEDKIATFTAPSDYYDFHDARHYFYSRGEGTYSGNTLVEVLDIFAVKQIGLRIGFDEADELIFRMYGGEGEILGNYAAYGGFATEEYPVSEFVMPNNLRMGYRPNGEFLTMEEVEEAIRAEGSWKNAFGGPGKEDKMMPTTDALIGKTFSLSYDDGETSMEYEITGKFSLKFREAGASEWIEERYEAFEVDDNLFFFTHAIDSAYPTKIFLNIIDLDNGLATTMTDEIMVDPENPRNCIPTFHFGVINIEGVTPVENERHGFTNDLLGKSFTWTYNDAMVSQHFFATPDSLYYSILMGGEPVLMWSCDGWYVKFRDDCYLFSWMESFSSGQNDTKIFNLNAMHDAGVCFGIPDGAPFEYNTFGSEARSAGEVDVSGIFGE